MAIVITRQNPKTGRIERPWRNRDGQFVLGNPEHGAQKHHDKFAEKVSTIEAALALIQQGFSIRMTDGDSPAVLISPDSLEIVEEEDADPNSIYAETRPKPPFSKEDMMAELKRVLLVQASQIAHAGSLSHAAAFIGFETNNTTYPYCEDDTSLIDLTRFNATGIFEGAYDYAFQVGKYWAWQDGLAQDINELVRGANPCDCSGEASPLANLDGRCRVAADTAFARWKLSEGLDLSLRDLALLARMKDAAVRNALSKEKIALEKGEVAWEEAKAWLQNRRDFVATRVKEGTTERWHAIAQHTLEHNAFGEGFGSLLRNYPMTAEALAENAKVPLSFVKQLAAGSPQPDVNALQRVAEALDVDVPHFVGVAVQAALRRQASA